MIAVEHAAVLAGRADDVFHREDLLGHAGAFPLAAIAGGEEKSAGPK